METTLHFPGHTPWSLALVGVLGVSSVAVFLWRLRPRPGRRLVAALRLLAVGGVLLAYFQPAIRVEEVLRAPSPVLILVDESASMEARGPDGRRRSDRVADFFRQESRWLAALEERHDVHYFACSDHARPVERQALEVPLSPRGASTDLDACVDEALAAGASRTVGGVLVVTDGADPDGPGWRPADRPAPPSPSVPMWVLLASDPDETVRDLAVADVEGTDFVLARNLAEVHVRIEAKGIAPERTKVTLTLDGEVQDFREVALSGDGTTEVALSFLPREPGRRLLVVEVPVLPGEASDRNNRFARVVNVVRDRLRVLHVAGHPSWDLRFFREYLRSKRGVELVSFHLLRDPEVAWDLPDEDATMLIPFPAEEIFVRSVESFDLVVFQDYEVPEADRERFAARLEQYVAGGGAFLFFGGDRTLGVQGPWPTHLGTLLPVLPPRLAGRGMMTGPFQARVPLKVRGHPVFWGGQGQTDLVRRVEAAPPLPAIVALDEVAPGAETVIEAVMGEGPARGLPGEERGWPLVVVAGHGRGVVGVVTTDVLWRWAFEEGTSRLYADLLDGIIAVLTKDPEFPPVRVRVERDLVAPGAFFGVEVATGRADAEVLARVERQTGPLAFEATGIEARAHADAEGRVSFRFFASECGPHRVAVTVRAAGEERSASDVFVVGPKGGEMVHIRATGRAAQALARRFGGEVHPLSASALDRFRPRGTSALRTGARVEVPVWNHPSILLLVIILFGLEWYLERRIGQA